LPPALSEDEVRPTIIDHVTGPWREPPGEDLSRILSLSDGIFAFAMTLLVVNLTNLSSFITCGGSCTDSNLFTSIIGNWRAFLGYATVFLIAALYWTAHHRTFRYIERYDTELIWLNIGFLLTIAFLPFVLEIYNAYPDHVVTLTLTSANMAASGLLLGAMWYHASGDGHLVDPKLDARVISYYRRRGFIMPAIFIIAIPIAFVVPAYASYVWIASFPAATLVRRYGSA
jgi:uncharacterized membrane protein